MSLKNTQQLFSDALLTANPDVSHHPVESLIRTTGDLSAKQRLDIYRSTGVTAQINALKQIYSVCEQVVGKRAFASMSRNYALAHPSHSPDLNVYGDSFNEYVDKVQREHGYTDFYYLKDLCSLERLWHNAYYAEDDAAFDFIAFQAEYSKGAEVMLKLSHSLTLMKTEYPVHLIWQQHVDQQQKSVVKSTQEIYFICIYRDEFQPKVEVINDSCFYFLLACQHEMSLQDIAMDEQCLSAMNVIPDFIERGWISGFSSQEK